MQIRTARPRLTAVLGPTNTGKTHLAMDRMLGHASGMIGFPLRLLARENYERAVRAKGRGQVALITGEEKILPPGARYFVCTAESMPLDRDVHFLGLDEVQMCADSERGHVFTDRLLNARGREETMVMGADTMRPVLRALVPDAQFESRPRFSTLSYTGHRKVSRLPPRSAVVAFSAAEVYAIAEQVRRQRGGAAVVMGALSPRTRNAQVAMYQAGEVDYLVATDAIGMGLNMDVDHVAFAGTRKFDGRDLRTLAPAELGQIAGRAGRHMNDGTFGATADAGSLDEDSVARIENHQFEPLRTVFWRNPALRFRTLDALIASLAQRPDAAPTLLRAREADDERALIELAKDSRIRHLASSPDTVRLLWDVCRVPDFRKVSGDAHARLLGHIFRHLTGPREQLPGSWMARQVTRLDRTDGDIETLMQRIAGIRIWTYVSYQGSWLDDARHWQERTRQIEDRLSDALHDRLTQRFVDRHVARLVGRLKDDAPLDTAVKSDGQVVIEGRAVGTLEGFRFRPEAGGRASQAQRTVVNAVDRALRGEVAARVRRLEGASDADLRVTPEASLLWRDEPVGRLTKGVDILRPGVEPLNGGLTEPEARERIRRRLAQWVEAYLDARLGALAAARKADLTGATRGIVYRLGEALGSLPRRQLHGALAALAKADRALLRGLGIRIGRESVYLPALVKPAAVETRALLWSLWHDRDGLPSPPPGRVAVALPAEASRSFYDAVGYRPLGTLAVRLDILERLAGKVAVMSQEGAFKADAGLLNLLGCGAEDMTAVLGALGFETLAGDDGTRFRKPRRRRAKAGPAPRRPPPGDDDSPFAKLRELAVSR